MTESETPPTNKDEWPMPVDCDELPKPNAGPHQWYACVRERGHEGKHLNRSGHAWPSETPPSPDVGRVIERLNMHGASYGAQGANGDSVINLLGEAADALAALQARETELRETLNRNAAAAVSENERANAAEAREATLRQENERLREMVVSEREATIREQVEVEALRQAQADETKRRVDLSLRLGQILGPDYDGVPLEHIAIEFARMKSVVSSEVPKPLQARWRICGGCGARLGPLSGGHRCPGRPKTYPKLPRAKR